MSLGTTPQQLLEATSACLAEKEAEKKRLVEKMMDFCDLENDIRQLLYVGEERLKPDVGSRLQGLLAQVRSKFSALDLMGKSMPTPRWESKFADPLAQQEELATKLELLYCQWQGVEKSQSRSKRLREKYPL